MMIYLRLKAYVRRPVADYFEKNCFFGVKKLFF